MGLVRNHWVYLESHLLYKDDMRRKINGHK